MSYKAIPLTFSKKNLDVYDIIQNRDTNQYKQATDFICDAIRAFDPKEYNRKTGNLSEERVKVLINDALETLKEELLNSNITLKAKETKEILTHLEEDLGNHINCEDD